MGNPGDLRNRKGYGEGLDGKSEHEGCGFEDTPRKSPSKDPHGEVALPVLELNDKLAEKEMDKSSSAQTKAAQLDYLKNPDYSDPFDELAVLPEDEEEDDPATLTITVRSAFVGILIACFGGGVSQLFVYKPVHLHIHVTFLQLACLILGRLLATIPGPKWFNPGKISVKETVFSAIIATSGTGGAMSVEMIASLDVMMDRPLPLAICVMTIMSSQIVGYAWAGLYRRFLIYPKKIIFPSVLPSVALFHSLESETPSTASKVAFFKKMFCLVGLYQFIPEYLAPALQAISPWCLTLPQVPAVTQLFGGSLVAEGLGLFALSTDWVIIGGFNPLFVPLAAQITDWLAYGTAIFLFTAAYRYDWFGGGRLPFISFDALDSTGARYNLTRAIFRNGTENTEEVAKMGLPYMATGWILGKAGTALAVTSAIVQAILFNYSELKDMFSSQNPDVSLEDPHRTITKKYPNFPTYGFLIVGGAGIALAFLCSFKGESGLSVYGLAFAFFISALLSFAAGFFYGTVGIPLHCHPVVQMIGGILFDGNAVGNMWFTMYGSTSAAQCVLMLKDLKLGQYLNLSGMSVVIGQLTGTVIGAMTHFAVMKAIVSTQREVLLLPHGDGVFTGMALSGFTAQATTWGLFSHRLYFAGCRYAIIPYCLLAGFFIPIPFFILHKWKPHVGFDRVNTSLYSASLYHSILGATSGRFTAILIGIVTQYSIRKYHFRWYMKYNYILNAAMDGGTQLCVLLLTFFFQGGSGWKLIIPFYFLNPDGPRDYCYLPTAKHH